MQNVQLVDRVRAIAEARGATASQLALAWVLAQGEDIVALFGTKRRRWLEENVGASGLTLRADELAQLDAASPRGAAAGERYPDMRHVNR